MFNTLCIVCTEDPWENAAKKALSLNMFDVFYRSSHLKQKITNKESHSRQREINALKSNVKLVSKTIIKHNVILQVVSERVNNFTAWRLMRRPGPELVHLQSDQISFYKKPIDTKYEFYESIYRIWICGLNLTANTKRLWKWDKYNFKARKLYSGSCRTWNCTNVFQEHHQVCGTILDRNVIDTHAIYNQYKWYKY